MVCAARELATVLRIGFLMVLMTVLSEPLFPSAGRSANNPSKAQSTNAKKSKQPASKGAPLYFEEAQALRQAYLLLDSANADYDGHRVKAMKAVSAALKLLDTQVMKHGTAEMKQMTLTGQAQLTQAAHTRPAEGKNVEVQGASDQALQQAAVMLAELQATMSANKQSRVLAHIERAAGEIKTALSIR